MSSETSEATTLISKLSQGWYLLVFKIWCVIFLFPAVHQNEPSLRNSAVTLVCFIKYYFVNAFSLKAKYSSWISVLWSCSLSLWGTIFSVSFWNSYLQALADAVFWLKLACQVLSWYGWGEYGWFSVRHPAVTLNTCLHWHMCRNYTFRQLKASKKLAFIGKCAR